MELSLSDNMTQRIDAFISALNEIGRQLGRIADAIRPRPKQPEPLKLQVTAERQTQVGGNTVDLLSFVLTVPPADGDVVNRKLALTMPDGTVVNSEVAGKDAADSETFEVPQDSVVKVSCVNVDDAGNESDPRVQEFTIADTIPPAAPGEMAVKVTSERTVDTPPSP